MLPARWARTPADVVRCQCFKRCYTGLSEIRRANRLKITDEGVMIFSALTQLLEDLYPPVVCSISPFLKPFPPHPSLFHELFSIHSLPTAP